MWVLGFVFLFLLRWDILILLCVGSFFFLGRLGKFLFYRIGVENFSGYRFRMVLEEGIGYKFFKARKVYVRRNRFVF